ncbi:hypothetical protein A3735_27135 [Oleiphilus sp. HI0061]|uniref:hypothetical protein n=1 Tax=Oleiphilus sp. HI0061 TaxID=1822239 RepID=UPI0007CF9477|nr:hypothetical protein [Oleiphilus sp. HI0061]KZY62515.1 hypothetical protein A3735_27190 [Oleiphilus sp. HI0061]KZY62530.1 hypothetical protein A3735_27135 [Oleiphilus sp. HI0061]
MTKKLTKRQQQVVDNARNNKASNVVETAEKPESRRSFSYRIKPSIAHRFEREINLLKEKNPSILKGAVVENLMSDFLDDLNRMRVESEKAY